MFSIIIIIIIYYYFFDPLSPKYQNINSPNWSPYISFEN